MKVFIGLTEVANCVHNYAKGFRDLGVGTFTVLDERGWPYADSKYDVVLTEAFGPPPKPSGRLSLKWHLWRLRYYLVLLRAALTCDVFIFTFGSAFRADRRDYWLLKRLGKRIVSVFLGSDTRYWYAYTQEAELLGTDADIRPYLDTVLKEQAHDYLAVKLETVRQAEAYSDVILALPDAAQLQTRPYMRLNIPIDLTCIDCAIHDRARPLVVHAPSARSIKGTDRILEVVAELQRDGVCFDFRLIEKTPNRVVREVLSESDIVIDQLNSETVATLALEALAAGNVVLARYLPDRVRIAPDCPVVNVNGGTLAARLREVIEDRELRGRLARLGRPYVERYHSHVVVAKQILEWVDPRRRGDYHFHPTFFRDHFVMSASLARREREQLKNEPPHWLANDLAGVRFVEDGPCPAGAERGI